MKKLANAFCFGDAVKRILAITLMLALILTVAGCGSDKTPSDDTSSDEIVSGEDPYDPDDPYDPEDPDDPYDPEDPDDPYDPEDPDDNNTVNINSGSTNSGKTTSQKTNSQSGSTTTAKVVNNCYTTGTKIAKDKVTFKVMIRDDSFGSADYNKTDFITYVLKTFNIKIEFDLVSFDQVTEKLTATLAAGGKNYPDMIMGMAGGYDTLVTYIDQGKFYDLKPYISQYGSNIQKMFKEAPETVYLSTYDDGKTYMLPSYSVDDNFRFRLFINKTWLSNLGLKMPTTTAELYNVLKAFKNNDPNKNGLKDEVPFWIPVGDAGIGNIPESLFSPFGIYTHGASMGIDQKTGKVTNLYVANEYRNGLRYYKSLLDAGFFPENWTSVTSTQIKNGTSGKVQTVGVFAATNQSVFKACSEESYHNNYTLMPALTDDASRKGNWVNTMYDNMYPEWFLMTKSCKYPEVGIRLVDWMYSEGGSLSALYGIPGEDKLWNYDSKGNYVAKTGKRGTTPGYALPHYWPKNVYDIRNSMRKLTGGEKDLYDQSKSMYSSLTRVKMVPNMVENKSERKARASANLSDPTHRGAQYLLMFVRGEKSIDNDWNSYLAELDKLGINKLISLYQSQYNRYLTYMKKAGK